MGLKICYRCGDISYRDGTICSDCQNLYDGEYINTYHNQNEWIEKYCNDNNVDKEKFRHPSGTLFFEEGYKEVENYIREWFFEKENDPDKYNEILKRRRIAAIHRRTKMNAYLDKCGNYEVCSKCGNVGNDSITGLCTQCNGELIDTGKLPTEWVKIYYDEHPEISPEEPPYEAGMKDFIREIFLEELPDPAFVARVKAQNEKKTSTGSSYTGEPCPKCHSTNTGYDRRGFSVGKAVAATALTGFVDVGAVAGAVGRNKPVHVCHNCGHRWK